LTEESRQESIKKEMIEKEHSDLRRYLEKGEGHDNARNYINMVFDDIESGREMQSYDLPRQIHNLKSESSESPEPRESAPTSMMGTPRGIANKHQNSTKVQNSRMNSLNKRNNQYQMSV
jgi:hypothetical protein